MKKKFMGLFLAATMLFSIPLSNVQAAGSGQIFLIADGLLVDNAGKYLNVNGSYLEEATELFQILNIQNYTIDTDKGTVWFSYGKTNVSMAIGSSTASVNGKSETMPAPISKNSSGDVYIPLKFVAELCADTVAWDGPTMTIKVETPSTNYSVVDFNQKAKIGYKTTVLSTAQAVQMASAKDATIKNSTQTITDLQLKYKDDKKAYDDYENSLSKKDSTISSLNSLILADNQAIQNANSTLSTAMSTGANSNQINALLANVNLAQAKLSTDTATLNSTIASFANSTITENTMQLGLQADLDQVASTQLSAAKAKATIQYNIIKQANAIKTATLQYAVDQQGLNLEKTALANIQLKQSLGLASDSDVTTEKNTLLTKETNLSTEQVQLETAKQNLNSTIGLPVNTVLSIDATQPFGDVNVNLESYISTCKANSTTIKLAQTALNTAQANLDTWNRLSTSQQDTQSLDTTASNGTATKTAAVDLAKTNYDNAVNAVITGVSNAYNSLKTSELAYQNDQTAFTKSINDYNSAVVSYIAGKSTFNNVNTARAALFAAETKLQIDKINYSVSLYQFNHVDLIA